MTPNQALEILICCDELSASELRDTEYVALRLQIHVGAHTDEELSSERAKELALALQSMVLFV